MIFQLREKWERKDSNLQPAPSQRTALIPFELRPQIEMVSAGLEPAASRFEFLHSDPLSYETKNGDKIEMTFVIC